MPLLQLRRVLFPIILSFSTTHAFGPYARGLNNNTLGPTASEPAFTSQVSSINGGTSSLVSSLVTTNVFSSDIEASTATGSSDSPSTGTSNLATDSVLSTGVSIPSTTAPSGGVGGSTTGSIIAGSSLASNPSLSISTTGNPTDSISSGTLATSNIISSTGTGSISESSNGPASTGVNPATVLSTTNPGGAATTTNAPSPTSTGAAIVPSIVTATDNSGRSTTVTWSAVETGSTSTTDNSGHPTIIPAPFYVCNDPLCVNTGCVLAIFCSGGGSGPGFNGFPPPAPPPDPPGDDTPSDSASQNEASSTGSPSSNSASSTASATTSTSSSSGTCGLIATVADPGPTSAGDPDDGSRRRFRRGLESRILVAREAPVVSTIGSCNLANQVKIPLFSSYSQAMNLNKQPNANGGANGRIYNAIEKWYAENLAIDGSPFQGVKSGTAFSGSDLPGSIDHVWEKSNVADFLSSLLGSDFDCDDMNALFSCGVNLQSIFNQLPSMDPKNVQTGFAAMNRNLNGMKGWMFSQGFSVPKFQSIYNTNEKIVQGLERQAIIFDWFNSDSGIQAMHDQTNNRMYGAFLALDDYISTNKVQRANGRGDLTQQFGPTFKTWYGQLLDKTGSASYKWASDEVTRLAADTSLPPCLQKAVITFQSSPLYGADKFTIDQSHLSWTPSPITLKRSLFVRDGSCTLPTNTPSVSQSTAVPSSSIGTVPGSATPPTTLVSVTVTVNPSPTITSSPTPSASFGCSNPSPEDGDGLCTCSVGTSIVGTYTPSGTGADWGCPSSSPVATSAPAATASPSSTSCVVPDGCVNVAAPDGCAVSCS